jgi:phospholipid/cholesterol/gamma-HCH transport system substrate-binding protein
MQNKVNYAFVGVFVLVLMAMLIFIGIWLSKGWNAKSYTTYAAYMIESVSGLAQDGTVKYNGVSVGHICSITLDAENPQRVRLLMKIESSTPITEATTARLITQGITGVSFIELTANQPNAPRLIARPGELYPVIKTAPSLFSRLDTAASELIVRLNKSLDAFDKTFDKDAQQSIRNTLINLDKITKNFSENTQALDKTMQHADAFFKSGAAAGAKLSNGLNTFSSETLPKVNLLVENLTVFSNRLNDLGDEVSQNPSILLKGRVPFKKGPGE